MSDTDRVQVEREEGGGIPTLSIHACFLPRRKVKNYTENIGGQLSFHRRYIIRYGARYIELGRESSSVFLPDDPYQ